MRVKRPTFFIGRDPKTGEDVGIESDRHVLVTAQNQAGKGSGIIIPNLLKYPGSILCTDPNLENANVTAGPCQERGFETFVFDLYNRCEGRAAALRARWNVLAEVDIDSPTLKEDLWKIAEGCIAEPETKSDNALYFINGARELFCGAIAHILTTETNPARRNLPYVRTRIEFEGREFFDEMANNFGADGLPAAAARRIHAAGANEAGGILNTLYDQTRWLSSKAARDFLSGTEEPGFKPFRMEWLHSKKVRLYVGLPGSRTSYQSNCIRLIVNWALLVLGEKQGQPTATGHSVTLLLDEFGSSIGFLDYIDRHLGELRHYCRLAIFVQGHDQLKKNYPRSYEGFFQNCVCVYFGINDLVTAKHISETLGDVIWYEHPPSWGVSTRGDNGSSTINAGNQRHRERFKSPEAVMRTVAVETRQMLVLTKPHAMVLMRVPYWEMFQKHEYDPNPKIAPASSPSILESVGQEVRRWFR